MKKKCTKWNLTARTANYIERNGKMSPLVEKEYIFLKGLYMYLTKQVLTQEFKNNLYKNYTELVDACFFPNRDSINKEMVECLYQLALIILEREKAGPVTFISLNLESHYKKMYKIIDLLRAWSINPQYYGHASEKEFWESIDFLRKLFNEDKIDIYYQTGKWPKKFRKRFQRENIKG